MERYLNSQNFGDLMEGLENDDWFEGYSDNDIILNSNNEVAKTYNNSNRNESPTILCEENFYNIERSNDLQENLAKTYLESLQTGSRKRKVYFILFNKKTIFIYRLRIHHFI